MPQLTLRPMTKTEYEVWRPGAVADYANDRVHAGSMPADQAGPMAEKQFSTLLPDALDTSDHHLLVAESDDSQVGLLWLHIPAGSTDPATFIYDVHIDEASRSRGLGRALMLAGEDYARDRGSAAMRLHVFGDNTVARRLYESLGYAETNVMMAKSLDPAD